MLEFQLTDDIRYEAEQIFLEQGITKPLESVFPAIVFVKEADIDIHFSSIEKKHIPKGQLFLLPRDFPCLLVSESDQSILLLKIPNITSVYIHFMPSIPKEEISTFNHLFYPVEIKDALETVANSISFYIEQKQTSNQLMGLKTFELFYFIRAYYPTDLIIKLFTPVLKKDYVFALFVLSNYATVKNAEELACLSNYTFSGFDKQFRKVFGIAPYKWMLQKKVNKIYLEICTTTKPIKVIAEEFGFTNSSHLGDFCRKHIGMSPARIRKKEIG